MEHKIKVTLLAGTFIKMAGLPVLLASDVDIVLSEWTWNEIQRWYMQDDLTLLTKDRLTITKDDVGELPEELLS